MKKLLLESENHRNGDKFIIESLFYKDLQAQLTNMRQEPRRDFPRRRADEARIKKGLPLDRPLITKANLRNCRADAFEKNPLNPSGQSLLASESPIE